MATPKFAAHAQTFHAELRRRINEHFQQTGTPTTGNAQLYLKAIILVSGFIAVYVHLVFFTPPGWLAILECLLLGGLTAGIGFNVMHDGAHGSFSRHNWVNDLAGMTVDFLGASVYMWKTKHNTVHHTFTNIEGVDDDIEAGPLLRLSGSQKHYFIHRYQHFYFWITYSFLYFYWVFASDYKKYFTGRVGIVPIRKMTVRDHITFWSFKVIHLLLFIALPIYQVGFLPWLIGFLVFGSFAGFVLSIVFQLAHTVSDTAFPRATQPANQIEEEWAVHQLRTTANFATRNKVISWFTGGLNYQIEHHLFPKISHIHYPAISKIIRQACEDYDIRYIEYPKMRLAIASHWMYLRSLSRA